MRAARASAMAVAWRLPTPSTSAVVDVAGADADEHAGRAGAHQVQGGLVAGAAADDHRDLELAHEVLEVERLAVVLGHVLGRDDRALDDQQVGLGRDDVGQQRRRQAGRDGRAHRCAGLVELGDPRPHQLRLHRRGVDRGQPGGDLVVAQLGDLVEERLGVLVAGPEPFEVQGADRRRAGSARRHDAGLVTQSWAAPITGMSNGKASICQTGSTSSASRVRREGTMRDRRIRMLDGPTCPCRCR